MGCVFTAVCLGFIVGLIGCGFVCFLCGLTWHVLSEITISDHANNVIGNGFVGASEFSLLGGGYLCVSDEHLVHEVLIDDDGDIFEIIGLGKDP